MFGKFGGIVIIALSIAIVAGLVLRSTPEHPPALSLGVTDSKEAMTTKNDSSAPAAKAETPADASQTEASTVEVTKEKMTEESDSEKPETKSVTNMLNEKVKIKPVTNMLNEAVTDTVDAADEVVGNIKEAVKQ